MSKKKDEYASFDIRTVSDKEWPEFEKHYIKAVNNITIPSDLGPRDILEINAEIDEVYSQARFDFAYAKQRLERYEQKLSNARKTMKLVFKKQRGQTNEDREAIITEYLETHALKGDSEPLYTLIERWRERYIFMEAVLDNLSKKADKMLTGNGALKLDAKGRGDTRK